MSLLNLQYNGIPVAAIGLAGITTAILAYATFSSELESVVSPATEQAPAILPDLGLSSLAKSILPEEAQAETNASDENQLIPGLSGGKKKKRRTPRKKSSKRKTARRRS